MPDNHFVDRPDLEYPIFRSVEVHPIEQEGEELICLRDPLNLSKEMLCLTPLAFFMVTFFDGKHSIQDIQSEVVRQFGLMIPAEKIEGIILHLDRALFLESDPFKAAYKAVLDAFYANPVRPAVHAGTAYESDPVLLNKQLKTYMDRIDGHAPRSPQQSLTLLIAPHIDIHRGGNGFAYAYREILDRQPADLYIILGTAHQSQSSFWTLTRKSYETPLGLVKTDEEFVQALSQRVDLNCFEEELLHRDEHSIEFQTLWLRYVLGDRWKGKVVPILCGSFHEFIVAGVSPLSNPYLRHALDELRVMIAEYPGRVALIAGVDFSHVGKRFGSDLGIPPEEIERVEKEDQDVMDAIVTGDAEKFFATVQKNKDRNHLCGLSPIYMALSVAQPDAGSILSYEISVEKETDSLVSFASICF